MKTIRSPDAGAGVQKQFGLTGGFLLNFDETVVPVQDVGDFAGKSPWQARRIGADSLRAPAAGAGHFSAYIVRPGLGTVLVIEAVTQLVANTTIVWKLMRPADLALPALTITGFSPIAQTNGIINPSTGLLPQLAAQASIGDSTTTTIGAEIHRANGVTNVTNYWQLPRGIILDGRDPAGLGALMILCLAANTELTAGVFVTEYQGPPTG